jgi:hypothetical protein
MFKCPLKKEFNKLEYDFPMAVFELETFNFDRRRKTIDVRVVGFADENAYNKYKAKIQKSEYHDLERSMVMNQHFSINIDEVKSSISEDSTDFDIFINQIEEAVITTQQVFEDARK